MLLALKSVFSSKIVAFMAHAYVYGRGQISEIREESIKKIFKEALSKWDQIAHFLLGW